MAKNCKGHERFSIHMFWLYDNSSTTVTIPISGKVWQNRLIKTLMMKWQCNLSSTKSQMLTSLDDFSLVKC